MEESDNLVGKLEINRIGQADRADVIWLTPKVDGHFLSMELDTGSAISLVCKSTYEKYFAGKELRESPITLKTYSGEKIVPLGVMTVSVSLNNQKKEQDLFVVSQQGPPLFGRDWLHSIKLNWNVIKSVTTSPKRTPLETVDDLKKKYSNVFKEELGTLKHISARINVPEEATPKFCKARSVPYAMRPQVDKELDRLVNTGILRKVEHSEWAMPIVPIPKKDGTVRLCGDFKVTMNPVLNTHSQK